MSEPTRVLVYMNSLTQTGALKIALDVFRHLADQTPVCTLALDGGQRGAYFEKRSPLRLFSELPGGGSSLAGLGWRRTRHMNRTLRPRHPHAEKTPAPPYPC